MLIIKSWYFSLNFKLVIYLLRLANIKLTALIAFSIIGRLISIKRYQGCSLRRIIKL